MGGLFGSTTTQVEKTTVPGAGAQERYLQRLLAQFAAGGEEALGPLIRGELAGPTGAERKLVAESIGAAREMAQRELKTTGALQRAQLGEQLTARGIGGASAESVQRMLQSLGESQQIAQAISQAQAQGGQALLNLPFQRAATQLSANQALFNRIVGSASPVLQGLLGERLAQTTTRTKTKQQGGLGDILKLAMGIGGMFINPVAGGAMLGMQGAQEAQTFMGSRYTGGNQ